MTDLPTLYVSRFSNPAIADHPELAPIRFTLGHPRFRLRYDLAGQMKVLAPLRTEFHLPHDEFVASYRGRLDDMDHLVVAAEIQAIIDDRPGATGAVLLCFEDVRLPGDWCHRTIFADWWKSRTGVDVPELENPVTPKGQKPAGMLTLF